MPVVRTCPACGHQNPESSRFCGSCAGALELAARERRKLATLLFCDVSGSTAIGEQLDAEAVRELMFRYFHTMRGAIEGHGGTVEKFIGDAVMAVFGIPESHEDDALRAVRAAAEMQERMAELNVELARTHGQELRLRIGVNTGEVVAGDATSRLALVTGDAVNVAARLEQAAAPGEVLLGPMTHRLVAHAVFAEATKPMELKGKSEAIPAYRLLAVRSIDPRAERAATEMIGRRAELTDLQAAFDRVRAGRQAELVTVIGEAGVGKSRLAAEFLARLATPHLVLRGRCLSYGEGITYWPIGEIARSAAAIHDEDDPPAALAKLEGLIGGKDAEVAALRVGQAIGLAGGAAPAEEISWAVRRLLEAVASGAVTVVVIDDLQWAEPSLLDLVRQLVATVEAPVLVLCLARPELAETHADWPEPVQLEPLEPADAHRLIGGLLDTTTDPGQRLAERLIEKAGGNPLFAEELVASLVDEGHLEPGETGLVARDAPDRIHLPDTLSALLGARIDRLAAAPRQALEGGAVEGEVFHRGAAMALADTPSSMALALRELTAKRWVNPARSDFVDEAAFRFRHLLVRDAAYGSIPKRRRAALHRLFAEWLAARVGARETEFEEILGYHLEQAYRYECELGPPDPGTVALGNRAAEFLYAAGRRAVLRGDQAARQLLQRSIDLAGDQRRRLEIELVLATVPMTPRLVVLARLASVRERARAAGEDVLELHARTEELWALSWTDPIGAPGRITELEEIILRLRRLHDAEGLARALKLQAEEHFAAGRGGLALAIIDEAIAASREAGDTILEENAVERRFEYILWGPVPANEGIQAAREQLDRVGPQGRLLRATTLEPLAVMLAMLGRAEEAHAALTEAKTIEAELGVGSSGQLPGAVLSLTGDLPGAERELRAGAAALETAGGTALAATSYAQLAQVLLARGAVDEAMEKAEPVEATTSADDVSAIVPARCVPAEVLAERGEIIVALQLADSAVSLADTTDWPALRGEARMSQARVLAAAGKTQVAVAVARAAEDHFRQKGNFVDGERASQLAAEFEASFGEATGNSPA